MSSGQSCDPTNVLSTLRLTRKIHMAVRVFNVILVLVLSLVTLGECGSVPCKMNGAIIHRRDGQTANDAEYDYPTHVPTLQPWMCYRLCKDYCQEKRPALTRYWVDCEAFSSKVELGGTCYCYGWKSFPDWYDDDDYTSGWCGDQ